MPGGGKGKGPAAKSRKRKTDSQNVGHKQKIKRTSNTDVVVDVLDQQSQLNDSWSDDGHSQMDQALCKVCQQAIDVYQPNDDPLDFLCCSYCNASSHIACLGVGSVFDGVLKDLLQLIGWQCSDCRGAIKLNIRKLENTCSYLKGEVTKLKTTNLALQGEISSLRNAQQPSSITSLECQPPSLDSSGSHSPVIDPVNPAGKSGAGGAGGAVLPRSSKTACIPVTASLAGTPESNIDDILKAVHADLIIKK